MPKVNVRNSDNQVVTLRVWELADMIANDRLWLINIQHSGNGFDWLIQRMQDLKFKHDYEKSEEENFEMFIPYLNRDAKNGTTFFSPHDLHE